MEKKIKVYDVAAITDDDVNSKTYKLEFVTLNTQQDLLTHDRFIGLNNVTAKFIRDAIEEGKEIRILKEHGVEVMPQDLVITNTSDSLEVVKTTNLRYMRQMVTHQQAVVSGIQVYEFIMI